MKNTRICPKCTSYTIAVIPGLSNPAHRISIGRYSSDIYPDLYICRQCGYVEAWLNDADLEILRGYVSEGALF